ATSTANENTPDTPDPKTTDDAAKAPRESAGPSTTKFTRRYLMLENSTKEKLTIYVQYETQNAQQQWTWVPAGPDDDSKTLKMERAHREPPMVRERGGPTSPRRVRLWAVSAGGAQWLEYKTQDLLLIPEEDDQGERWYSASGMDTFTFTFTKE